MTLSSLSLSSVTKYCLRSDITLWLVYFFLGSSAILRSFFVFSLLSAPFLHLCFLSVGQQGKTLSVQVFLCRNVLHLDPFLEVTFSPMCSHLTQLKEWCWGMNGRPWVEWKERIYTLPRRIQFHNLVCQLELSIIILPWPCMQLIHLLAFSSFS